MHYARRVKAATATAPSPAPAPAAAAATAAATATTTATTTSSNQTLVGARLPQRLPAKPGRECDFAFEC